MQDYVRACVDQQRAEGLAESLARIVTTPALHARFVNTLSRMEYVGVRKILKSRRSESLDLDGLQHMLEEAVHTLRLKKAAVALAGAGGGVTTFSDEDTLGGDAGEAYLQGVDQAALAALGDVPEPVRGEANYVLTSAAIEVRAQAFYPLYEQCLKHHGAGFSVSSILKDEDRHLSAMEGQLERLLPETWRPRLERVLQDERSLFSTFTQAVTNRT